MNIAMLTNNYKPFVAGVPIAVERLADGLRALGHTVYIFAPDYHDEESAAVKQPDFSANNTLGRTYRFPTTNIKMAGIMPLPFPIYHYLDSVFSDLDIDIIHVHHPVLTGNAALRLGKKYNVPVVFTYHTRYEQYIHYAQPFRALEQISKEKPDTLSGSAAHAVIRFTKNDIVQRYLNYFAGRCDLVVVPTETMADYLSQFPFPTPTQIIPTGLSAQTFDIRPSAQILRRKYLEENVFGERGISSEETPSADVAHRTDRRYLFCTVSRLAKEKNLDFMLRALALAKEQLGDIFRVLIIGDGPQRQDLELQAQELGLQENIIFTGAVPNEEISAYHQACDLFLFSSRSETQGIVLLEAFAGSLPAIAIAATGTSDLIEHEVNGILTAADERDWAEKLTKLISENDFSESLSRESILKRMGAAARETALQYEESRIAGKAAAYYRRTIYEKNAAYRLSEKISY